MFFLGALYSNEHGSDAGQHTNITAYAWLQNALELGNPTASAIQSRIVMKLSEETRNWLRHSPWLKSTKPNTLYLLNKSA